MKISSPSILNLAARTTSTPNQNPSVASNTNQVSLSGYGIGGLNSNFDGYGIGGLNSNFDGYGIGGLA